MARTLTYPDIKAGIRKAGAVPCLDCDKVEALAWLSAAGYGVACLPSLTLYQRFRAACKGNDTFSSRRRRRNRHGQSCEPGITTKEGAAAKLGIKFPGVKADKRKAQRTAAVISRLGYRSKSIIGQVKPETAEEKAKKQDDFKHYSGLFVAAAIKAHHASPSRSFISSANDTPDGKLTVLTLVLSTPTGVVVEYIPTMKDVPYHLEKRMGEVFHIGTGIGAEVNDKSSL